MSHSAIPPRAGSALRRPWILTAMVLAAILAAAGAVKLTSGPSGADTVKSYGIYTGQEVPAGMSRNDHRPIELGTTFQVSSPGRVTAIRFYKSAANTGTHTGTLWTAAGQKLASVTFAKETASGFQTAKLSTPVAISAYRNYVVSYHAPRGEWSSDVGTYWRGATIGNSVIKGVGGSFAFGTATRFPTASYHYSSYYVDVLFAPTGAPVTPPPSSSSAAPSASKTPTKAPTTSAAKPSKTVTSSAPPPSSSSVAAPPPASSSAAAPTPTATSNGVGVSGALRTVPGQLTSGTGWRWTGSAVQLTAANVTLSGLDINGSIQGSFSGVTIENTRIRCTNETNWCISLGDHNKLINDEIGGGANGSTFVAATGIWSGGDNAGNIIDAVDIHNTSDGLRIDGGTTLENSYIHNLSMGQIPGAHSDGVQSTGGANVTIANNRFQSGNNCNVFMQWLSGNTAISNYTVTGNSFTPDSANGMQTSYGVCGYAPNVSGVSITNNTFGYGYQVGPYIAPSGSKVSGNKYTDGKPA